MRDLTINNGERARQTYDGMAAAAAKATTNNTKTTTTTTESRMCRNRGKQTTLVTSNRNLLGTFYYLKSFHSSGFTVDTFVGVRVSSQLQPNAYPTPMPCVYFSTLSFFDMARTRGKHSERICTHLDA